MKYMVILSFIIIAGCTSYKAPPVYKFDNARIYDQPYSQVWDKAIQWFKENNFPIKSLSKDNGIIVADGKVDKLSGLEFDTWSGMETKNRVADCGNSMAGDFNPQQAVINIFLSQVGEGVKVSVNIEFSDIIPEPAFPMQCNSTGSIETAILQYIDGK